MNSNRPRVRRTPAVLALIAVIMVAGCASLPFPSPFANTQIDTFDKSATLRVEVEVYKGPLSKELAVQVAELKGIFDDSMRAMEILQGSMTYSPTTIFSPTELTYSLTTTYSSTTTFFPTELTYSLNTTYSPTVTYSVNRCSDNNSNPECYAIRQLHNDIAEVLKKYNEVSGSDILQECELDLDKSNFVDLNVCESLLTEVSVYGSHLKRRAEYWATDYQVAMTYNDSTIRKSITNFAQVAAEYGNQIVSRADALLKQARGARGIEILREQLPNSVYLRDSAPTAYLNLYEWNEIADKKTKKEKDDIADRARIVEHVIADNYWSHINTVFTAGQGKMYTALVKDDIGNWNVKSYDNSPGDLLDAYKELGIAALKGVIKYASGGKSSALDKVKDVFNSANQVALSSTGSSRVAETERRLDNMRIETARLIMKIGRAFTEEKSDNDGEKKAENGTEEKSDNGAKEKTENGTKEKSDNDAEKKAENGTEEKSDNDAKEKTENGTKEKSDNDAEKKADNDTQAKQKNAAVTQIRQLLELHNAMVSAMAVTAAEAASPPDAKQSLTETDTGQK